MRALKGLNLTLDQGLLRYVCCVARNDVQDLVEVFANG